MRNVLRLAAGDFKRLFSNIVSIIIVLGLVLLPSIFTWYNVLACWDVFGNTGNLKVAVANSDEGYQSDLVPLKVNIGDQVVSALRANDQMNWVFTDEEDAVDGAEARRYYAAVVIPQSFSRDMMTFYSGDVEHARIVYYSNEKKNAIAPKVTGQGADQISAQVNRVFAETLSETALGISQALLDYMDDTDAGGALGQAGRLDRRHRRPDDDRCRRAAPACAGARFRAHAHRGIGRPPGAGGDARRRGGVLLGDGARGGGNRWRMRWMAPPTRCRRHCSRAPKGSRRCLTRSTPRSPPLRPRRRMRQRSCAHRRRRRRIRARRSARQPPS